MDLNRLREIPLFASLPEEALAGIAPYVTESSVAPGATIIREGDFAYEFHAIHEGEADVVRGGRPVGSLGPGEYFGEIAVLDKSLRSASVIARTPMRLSSLSRWHVRRIGEAIHQLRETAEQRRVADDAV
jgi:CRP-like cAMP-binding protein